MALLNHLLARKWKGKWILRIEDTDRVGACPGTMYPELICVQERFVEGAVDRLRETLEWAGLDYDEGMGRGLESSLSY